MSDTRQPDVSVVIPSYNHASYIEAAVRSVLDATDPRIPEYDLELVVIDDGSTDDSVQRLEALQDDARVRLHLQENQGAHAALNRGISLSRGDIVFILNSDDLFEPRRVPVFLERFAGRPELMMLASWLEILDQDGASLGVKQGHLNMPPWPRPGKGPGLADLGHTELALLETNYISTTSNLAFRRSLFEGGARFLPLRYAHDWDFMLTGTQHGLLEIVEEPLISYRVHSSNTIKEGQGDAEGEMRFEILWVVARHALRLCRNHASRGHDPEDLNRRLWNSLPSFGYRGILSQLLALRGIDDEPPPSYDAMLDLKHPFRHAAIRVLAEASP